MIGRSQARPRIVPPALAHRANLPTEFGGSAGNARTGKMARHIQVRHAIAGWSHRPRSAVPQRENPTSPATVWAGSRLRNRFAQRCPIPRSAIMQGGNKIVQELLFTSPKFRFRPFSLGYSAHVNPNPAREPPTATAVQRRNQLERNCHARTAPALSRLE